MELESEGANVGQQSESGAPGVADTGRETEVVDVVQGDVEVAAGDGASSADAPDDGVDDSPDLPNQARESDDGDSVGGSDVAGTVTVGGLVGDKPEPQGNGPVEVDDVEVGEPEFARGPEAAQEAGVESALRGLEEQARRFHVRAENYEQIVRQMQTRIEQLQGDQVQALLKPVIQRFAGLHAQAVVASEEARDRGEVAEKDFEFFVVAIEEALGLVDIESVGAAPNVEFDSAKHHASRTVPTSDADKDRRIQRVLRQGFTYSGAPRVFLPAQVSVYRYEPGSAAGAEEPETNATSESGEGDSHE